MGSRVSLWLAALAAAFLVFITVEVLLGGAEFAIIRVLAGLGVSFGLVPASVADAYGMLFALAGVLAAPVAVWMGAGAARRGLKLVDAPAGSEGHPAAG